MTLEQAEKILNPETTREALAEIEYHSGFEGKAAKTKAVDDACEIACEVLRKEMENQKHESKSN